MSDKESNPSSIDASDAPIPVENGSREVENDPPPLGRAEESVSDLCSQSPIFFSSESLLA